MVHRRLVVSLMAGFKGRGGCNCCGPCKGIGCTSPVVTWDAFVVDVPPDDPSGNFGTFLGFGSCGTSDSENTLPLDLFFTDLGVSCALGIRSAFLSCDPEEGWALTVKYAGYGYSLTPIGNYNVTNTITAGLEVVYAVSVEAGNPPVFTVGDVVSRQGSVDARHWNPSAGGWSTDQRAIDFSSDVFQQYNQSGALISDFMDNLPVPYALANLGIACGRCDTNCKVHIFLEVTGCNGEPLQCGVGARIYWWLLSEPDTIHISEYIGAPDTNNELELTINLDADDPETFSADIGYFFEADPGAGRGFVAPDLSGKIPERAFPFFSATVHCGDVLSNCLSAAGSGSCATLDVEPGWVCALGFNMPLPEAVTLTTKYGDIVLTEPDYVSCDIYLDGDSAACDPEFGTTDLGQPIAVKYALVNSGGSLAVKKDVMVFCDFDQLESYQSQGASCDSGEVVQPGADNTCAAYMVNSFTAIISGTGNNVAVNPPDTEKGACGPISGTAQIEGQILAECASNAPAGFSELITVSGGQTGDQEKTVRGLMAKGRPAGQRSSCKAKPDSLEPVAEFIADRLTICRACPHYLAGPPERCGLLVARGKAGLLMHPHGLPNPRAECDDGRWKKVGSE